MYIYKLEKTMNKLKEKFLREINIIINNRSFSFIFSIHSSHDLNYNWSN